MDTNSEYRVKYWINFVKNQLIIELNMSFNEKSITFSEMYNKIELNFFLCLLYQKILFVYINRKITFSPQKVIF